MVVPSNGDVIEVAIEGEFDGSEDNVNVFHLQCSSITAADMDDFIDSVTEWVQAFILIAKQLVITIQWYQRYRTRNATITGPVQSVELAAPIAGIAAGAVLPPGNACLIAFRTPVKNVLLKKFIGVPGHTNLTANGQWDSTQLGLMSQVATFLMAPYTATDADFVYGYMTPLTKVFHLPITAYVSAEGAYQRRRRRGSGS